VPPNKGMKLTSAEHNERSQLIPGVGLTTGDGEERDVPTDAGLQNQWLTASAAIYALE
jgi:hypothetical protein